MKLIEGVGPKIEQLLHAGNIKSFAMLAKAPVKKLRDILTAAGPRFRMHNPSTWAQQARLARDGKMDALKKLQGELKGGRKA